MSPFFPPNIGKNGGKAGFESTARGISSVHKQILSETPDQNRISNWEIDSDW
jgi:hypothetical protein